jgi:hypothetical protein
VAERIARDPEALGSTLAAVSPEEVGVLELLAEGVVHQADAMRYPSSWLKAVQPSIELGRHPLQQMIVVATFLAALQVATKASLQIARCVFDPLLRSVRRHDLNRDQIAALERVLATRRASRFSLGARLIESAVATWPPEQGWAGALTLSSNEDHVRDLVEAVEQRLGQSALEAAQYDPDLSTEALARIRRRLDSPRTKSAWWF